VAVTLDPKDVLESRLMSTESYLFHPCEPFFMWTAPEQQVWGLGCVDQQVATYLSPGNSLILPTSTIVCPHPCMATCMVRTAKQCIKDASGQPLTLNSYEFLLTSKGTEPDGFPFNFRCERPLKGSSGETDFSEPVAIGLFGCNVVIVTTHNIVMADYQAAMNLKSAESLLLFAPEFYPTKAVVCSDLAVERCAVMLITAARTLAIATLRGKNDPAFVLTPVSFIANIVDIAVIPGGSVVLTTTSVFFVFCGDLIYEVPDVRFASIGEVSLTKNSVAVSLIFYGPTEGDGTRSIEVMYLTRSEHSIDLVRTFARQAPAIENFSVMDGEQLLSMVKALNTRGIYSATMAPNLWALVQGRTKALEHSQNFTRATRAERIAYTVVQKRHDEYKEGKADLLRQLDDLTQVMADREAAHHFDMERLQTKYRADQTKALALADRSKTDAKNQRMLAQQKTRIETLQAQLRECEDKLKEHQRAAVSQKDLISALRNEVAVIQSTCAGLKQQLATKDPTIERLGRRVRELQLAAEVSPLESEEHQAVVAYFRQEHAEMEASLQNLKQALAASQQQVQILDTTAHRLEHDNAALKNTLELAVQPIDPPPGTPKSPGAPDLQARLTEMEKTVESAEYTSALMTSKCTQARLLAHKGLEAVNHIFRDQPLTPEAHAHLKTVHSLLDHISRQ
jgi:hypothetical protein